MSVEYYQEMMRLAPTALPSRNNRMHNVGKELASDARSPKTDVKKSVALKAALLPIKSEPVNEL